MWPANATIAQNSDHVQDGTVNDRHSKESGNYIVRHSKQWPQDVQLRINYLNVFDYVLDAPCIAYAEPENATVAQNSDHVEDGPVKDFHPKERKLL